MKRAMLMFVMVSMMASPVWAAKESREKQMLRRMQQQMQQVEQARALAEQEKAAALAEKETLASEIDRLRADSATAKRERVTRTRLEHENRSIQAQLDALKTKLAETEKALADSQAQQRETANTLAQIESAKKQSETQLTGTRQDLKQCQTYNGKLYGLGREMMNKYRDKTCQDALAQAEPFTGLKKVEVENLLETWRDQLDREKLDLSKRP